MRPLVLVHGFMGGSAQWDLQQGNLGDGRQLICPDLPGFGLNNRSGAPETIRGFAEFVLEELQASGVSEFDLLGHSMGGMIVQEMMHLASERVGKFILYGTAASGNLAGRFETFDQSRRRALEDGVEKTARRISATWFLEFEKSAEFENCAAIACRSQQQSLQAGLTAMEDWQPELRARDISSPTLIIWGEADRTYRWPQTEHLWQTIPNAHLSVLPFCSHAAHLERPELFNGILRDFLDR